MKLTITPTQAPPVDGKPAWHAHIRVEDYKTETLLMVTNSQRKVISYASEDAAINAALHFLLHDMPLFNK